MSHRKDVLKLVRHARAHGWSVRTTGSGHLKLVPPDKNRSFLVISKTPSDRRAYLNIRAALRRRGLPPLES